MDLTIITTSTTTTSVVGLDQAIDAIFDPKDITADTAKEIHNRLSRVVLPWRANSNIPADFERRTATGVLLGLVSARLGEYTNPHHPEKHGWGYKANSPNGTCSDAGIVAVDRPGGPDEIARSFLGAQDRVDLFIATATALHGYTLL